MAQRPVKIVMSYWEELTASNPTHPTVVTIRSGVTRDGRLTAREVRTVHASGAYGAMKPRSFLSTSHYVGGGYRVPNTSFEFLQVYTNTTPGGTFEPLGRTNTPLPSSAIPTCWPELGMDPAAFRRMNLVGPGEEDAVGRPLRVADVRQVLEAAWKRAAGESPRPGQAVARASRSSAVRSGRRCRGRVNRRGGRHLHRPQSDGGCRHGYPHH